MTTVVSKSSRGIPNIYPDTSRREHKMASLFIGNPFSSVVGQKIEQATDASLPSENWALNMEICDIINETEDGPKDAMKAIRKRLSQNAARNFTVVMYTLIVLEACVKNCGKRFHILACNKEFILELVKLIGPKNGPPTAVQEKVLNLVQSWADAFKNEPELFGVVQVYNELKQKGMEFPAKDLNAMAPIHTPQRTQSGEPVVTAASDVAVMSPSPSLSLDQINKLSSELQVVEGNVVVLHEMLNELTPGKELPDELELMKELHSTCQEMQERLVELISQLPNDEITGELLRINDGLNNLFLRYSRYEKNRKSTSKEKENGETTLIDLSDTNNEVNQQLAELSLKTTSSSSVKSISSSTENNKDDEFDMFAQSRNVAYESTKSGSSSFEANKENLSGNLAKANSQPKGQIHNSSSSLPVPDLIGMHSERDFDEIAAWLGEKHEESLTSSEFEKFLAERAAAAETLPTNTENSSSRGTLKKEDDPMFAL